jgi:additional sex combs-like protein
MQNNLRPPPGAVNLERSYQICQAVIQNSPNRHQLNCHLKPPPTTLLGTQKKF